MISYITIGTNDFDAAERFFDALLAELGASQMMKSDRMIFWAKSDGGAGLALAKPLDGKPATIGNGSMVSLAADSREQVDALYAKALELGGTDEGAPGIRNQGFYVAYFRDLDGNKFNLFCAAP
jgi:catechol 2,3-dioxygenase-like lactoylglutathione lyase family enzyme